MRITVKEVSEDLITASRAQESIESVDSSLNIINSRRGRGVSYCRRMKTKLLCPPRGLDPLKPQIHERIVIATGDEKDRQQIYRLRHEIYARELGQYPPNRDGCLRDKLDDWNGYLVARMAGKVAGFVSISPPGRESYSIDKYVDRAALPFVCDDRLYEVRLLTVLKPHRGSELAALLMYAALRWIEAHGGTRVVAIGRREVVEMYRRSGLELVGITVHSGAVTYDLMQATVQTLRQCADGFGGLLDRLEGKTDWRLNFPFRKPGACFHGGQFFDAIGPKFDSLERSRSIVNADVLDAWFPPSPRVVAALQEHLPWILRTSPPTQAEGLIETIAEARRLKPENILLGGGSSDLIFRAFRHWLGPASHALVLDPTYGEYAHVLEQVIGCTVDRLPLLRQNHYDVDLDKLSAALKDIYDLIVLVNPNSPTGRHVPSAQLESVLRQAPHSTRVWLDETYVDYAGPGHSLEGFAADSENVVVCKSMSKAYALSGARVAYLCAGPHQLEALRAITPPWVVGLPAQIAAIYALKDPAYYSARYQETSILRRAFAVQLGSLGLSVVPGVANFLLCHLDSRAPTAATLVKRCREQGIFLRDAATMSVSLSDRAVRIAVKDELTNRRITEALTRALAPSK
jgi:histidinol-phosphate/aromatic aminotransferase/cobyric acid decarboxylase-like protein